MAEPSKPHEQTKPATPPVANPGPRPGVEMDGAIIKFKPKNFDELYNFVRIIADTDMVPAADRNKPGQVLAKIQYGSEVGLPPMQSLRWIAMLPNGLPTIWGAGARALVLQSTLCEWMEETPPHKIMELGYAECTIKRKGRKDPVTRRFTKEMAITAGLWGGKGSDQGKREQSTWFKYPHVMLAYRAFHMTVDAAVPEILGGLVPREIADDYDIEITAQKIEDPIPTPQPIAEEAADAPAGSSGDSPENSGDGAGAGTSEPGPETSASESPPPPENAPPAGKKSEPAKENAPQSLEQIVAWVQTATLEEVCDQRELNQRIQGRPQNEQSSICMKFNDRREQLLAEAEKKPPEGAPQS